MPSRSPRLTSPQWRSALRRAGTGRRFASAAVGISLLLVGCGEAGANPELPAGIKQDAASLMKVSQLRADIGAERIRLLLILDVPEDIEPPLARSVRFTLPEGVDYVPDRRTDGALVGRGVAHLRADGEPARADIVVRAAPDGAFRLHTTVKNPVRKEGDTVATVTDARTFTLRLPRELQVVAGVPLALSSLDLALDRAAGFRPGPCPAGGRWTYSASVTFADGSSADRTGTASC